METWQTKHEIQFIRSIGSHRLHSIHAPSRVNSSPRIEFLQDKLRLLEGYIRGNELRSDWGLMNKASVVEFSYEEASRIREAIDKERERIQPKR